MMITIARAAAIGLVLASLPICSSATAAQSATEQTSTRDGQKDFDWEIGTWTTKVKVRRNPLSGAAPDWVAFEGTSVVTPLFGGRANFVELSVHGPRGGIVGGSLRLYNPKGGQWSLNYANLGNGLLTSPVFGGFDAAGRGLFYGEDTVDGRTILVRFIITRVSAREAHFEQAYSADAGQTWEANWIAVDTRQ
jgi:hypothetical protein